MTESLELLTEILDKLIDTQVQSAQVTADLKNAVEDNNQHLKELHKMLIKINTYFSNGFRQELKEAIVEAVKRIESNIELKSQQAGLGHTEILAVITDFTNTLKSPKSWIGAFLLVVGVFGAIAGIVAIVSNIMGPGIPGPGG